VGGGFRERVPLDCKISFLFRLRKILKLEKGSGPRFSFWEKKGEGEKVRRVKQAFPFPGIPLMKGSKDRKSAEIPEKESNLTGTLPSGEWKHYLEGGVAKVRSQKS